MKRTWVVRPRPGELTVNRQDVLEAIEDAEAIQWRMGGYILIAHERVRADELLPDGWPGEAFTTMVVVEWKNRTDARENPEVTVPLAARQEPQEAPAEAAPAPAEAAPAPAPAPEPAPTPPASQSAVELADMPGVRRPHVALETAQLVQPVPGDDMSSVPAEAR